MKKMFVCFALASLASACTNPPAPPITIPPDTGAAAEILRSGDWRAYLYPDTLKKEQYILANFYVQSFPQQLQLQATGDTATVDTLPQGDSVLVRFPAHNTAIRARRYGKGELKGFWEVMDRDTLRRVAFAAYVGGASTEQFRASSNSNLVDASGNWLAQKGSAAESPPFHRLRIMHSPPNNFIQITAYNTADDSLFAASGLFDGARIKWSYFNGKEALVMDGRWEGGTISGNLWIKNRLWGRLVTQR